MVWFFLLLLLNVYGTRAYTKVWIVFQSLVIKRISIRDRFEFNTVTTITPINEKTEKCITHSIQQRKRTICGIFYSKHKLKLRNSCCRHTSGTRTNSMHPVLFIENDY